MRTAQKRIARMQRVTLEQRPEAVRLLELLAAEPSSNRKHTPGTIA